MPVQAKKCPFCAEEILFEAIKCKHCGEMLVKSKEPSEESGGTSATNIIGVVILFAGLAAGIYYWAFFDASIEVPREEIFGQVIGGGRVNNLGLLQQKQTGTLLGFGAAALGLVLALVGANKGSEVRTTAVQKAQDDAKSKVICPKCGQTEEVLSGKLYDAAQYQNFTPEALHGGRMLVLTCKKCKNQFRYD